MHKNLWGLIKAFDTVNHDGLWKIMLKFECPERFTHTARHFYYEMMARVTDNETILEAFAVTDEMTRNCLLASSACTLMFSAILTDAYLDEHPGISINCRTDEYLHNSRLMQVPTRLSTACSL
ncbi:hypothetical protein SprV_0902741800 [Sparganum proliferum]